MLHRYSTAHLREQLEFGHRRWRPISATTRTRESRWETCEIKDVEGIRASEGCVRCHWFQAYVTSPRGTYVAAESVGFYCPGFTPEPEHASAPHSALVLRLIGDGWEPTGKSGQGWWSLKFRRAALTAKP